MDTDFVELALKELRKFCVCALKRRHSGLVVERRTPEREIGGSILTQVAVLCP